MSKTVVLGVTGSIACYKAAEAIRLLRKQGWEVRVVMTRSAGEFVGELTFRTLSQNPVAVDMFEPPGDWHPRHIALADAADALVIAPCTANMIAKLATGLCDDLLSCVALACRAPALLAPAMNVNMWEHPATQRNVALLRERGVRILDVEAGDLACGYTGKGRMASPDAIVTALSEMFASEEKSSR